jgi:hypothetical protein
VAGAAQERITVPELKANHAARLRAVADLTDQLLATGTWFPVPTIVEGSKPELFFDFHVWELPAMAWAAGGDDADEKRQEATVERFRAASRALGGRWHKNDPKLNSYEDTYYTFTHDLPTVADLTIVLRMQRDVICERVQVGTEKKVIPAVEAQAEQVVDAPVYERECKPLFAKTEALMTSQQALEPADEVIDGELV